MTLHKIKTYNFASIFELEILEDISSNHPTDRDVCPTIYFEVNSVDYWNRHRIEGYGLLHLDLDRNVEGEICVSIWRPIGTIREEMRRFFIGGGKRLKDYKSIAIPQSAKESAFNSRCHWETLQTGSVYLTLNAVSTFNQTFHQRAIRSIPGNMKEPIAGKKDQWRETARKHKRKKTSKLLQRLTANDENRENQDMDQMKEEIMDSGKNESEPMLKPIHHKRHKRKTSKLLSRLQLDD